MLREAARDVITGTVYNRQKHPFLSPPATLNPDQGLNALVQDTLQVIGLLDALPDADEGSRVASDQLLMMLTSAAVLNDRYRLAA